MRELGRGIVAVVRYLDFVNAFRFERVSEIRHERSYLAFRCVGRRNGGFYSRRLVFPGGIPVSYPNVGLLAKYGRYFVGRIVEDSGNGGRKSRISGRIFPNSVVPASRGRNEIRVSYARIALSVEIPSRSRSFVRGTYQLPLRSGAHVQIALSYLSGEYVVVRSRVGSSENRSPLESSLVHRSGQIRDVENIEPSVGLVVGIYPQRVLEKRHGRRKPSLREFVFLRERSKVVERIQVRTACEIYGRGVLVVIRRLSRKSLVIERYRGEVGIRAVDFPFRENIVVSRYRSGYWRSYVNDFFSSRNDEEDSRISGNRSGKRSSGVRVVNLPVRRMRENSRQSSRGGIQESGYLRGGSENVRVCGGNLHSVRFALEIDVLAVLELPFGSKRIRIGYPSTEIREDERFVGHG